MALQTPSPRIRTREVEDMEEAATTTIMTRAEGYTAHLIQNRTRTQAAEGTEEITTTMRGQETQTPIRTRMEGGYGGSSNDNENSNSNSNSSSGFGGSGGSGGFESKIEQKGMEAAEGYAKKEGW